MGNSSAVMYLTFFHLDQNYDFVIVTSSLTNLKKITSGSISSFDAFTITTWVKHEEAMENDAKPVKYVDYRNANGGKLLLIYLTTEYFVLEIVETFSRQVYIPNNVFLT